MTEHISCCICITLPLLIIKSAVLNSDFYSSSVSTFKIESRVLPYPHTVSCWYNLFKFSSLIWVFVNCVEPTTGTH